MRPGSAQSLVSDATGTEETQTVRDESTKSGDISEPMYNIPI